MKFRFIFFSLSVFCSINSFAQSYFVLSGYITDSLTGEALINADVYDANSLNGTITNNYGYYSLKLPANREINLTISYIGYLQKKEHIRLTKNLTKNIVLRPNLSINEVKISSAGQQRTEEKIQMGTIQIPMKQIKTLPSIGGETDILKALQLMPGIGFGVEGKSGLYVRGGSPDQNLVLLDGVPLYYVNHLGGFVSIFNTDAINSIKMIKGSFPANYGGRLSSVLDVRMKDGDMKQTKGNITLGMLTTKVLLEGPIKKDTSSYLISVRRFMYDIFMKPISSLLTDVSLGYTFYDINAKYNRKFSPKDRLFLSFYMGNDVLSSKLRHKSGDTLKVIDKNAWGNLAGTVRWNHIYGARLFGNLTYSYTRYRYRTGYLQKNQGVNEELKNYFFSGVNDNILKYDLEFYPNQSLKIETGLSTTYHLFRPGVNKELQQENNKTVFDTTFNNLKYHSVENAAYILAEKKLTPRFGVNIGTRFSYYLVSNSAYKSIEPRTVLRYMVGPRLSLKGSLGYMQQYVHLLSSSGIGMPTDLWVLSTSGVPPEKAWQSSLGLDKSFKNRPFTMSIEVYYKKLSHLIDYREGASLLSGPNNWQEKIEKNGTGVSYGLEYLLQKKEGRTTGWLGMSLSHATREFANINSGKPYPYTYDRLLDLSLVVNQKVKKNINIAATWVFDTGNPLTLPVGYHYAIDDADWDKGSGFVYSTVAEIYNGKNTFRAKPYHRLDVGVNFTKQKRRGVRVLSLSIYNVYDHLNAFYYYSETLYDSNGNPNKQVMKKVSYFPIIPSISYSFNF